MERLPLQRKELIYEMSGTHYAQVRAKLDDVCATYQRNPDEVMLLAVSKTVDVDAVASAIQEGAHAFGENRPDELVRKQAAFPQEQWHFIGNIQSRKIPEIVSAATLIHSVCKESHLPKINTAAAQCGKVQRVLLEVNVSGEESKSGFSPDEVEGVIARTCHLEHVSIEGLMTMAPQGDPEAIEYTFSGLARLQDELNQKFSRQNIPCHLSDLSMGMSEDWHSAVAHGSTIVRVGRAVFSDSFPEQ